MNRRRSPIKPIFGSAAGPRIHGGGRTEDGKQHPTGRPACRARRILAIAAILIALLLCTTACSAYPLSPDDPTVEAGLDYLRTCQKADGGFGEAEMESSPGTTSWAIMAIVAAGEDPQSWTVNGTTPLDYLLASGNETIAKGGTADIARTILTLIAVGEDPKTFGEIDYVAELKQRVKPDGQAGDHIYTTIWTVNALAAAGENASTSTDWLIARQNPDGGFGWTEGAESDPDDTGAALMALSAAGVPPESPAIQGALDYLREMQLDDGGFHYGGTSASNSASDSWVIQGIVAAGEDPATWEKNGTDVVTHLESLQNPDGSFRHTAYVTDNPCRMTASAIPALLGMPYPIYPGQTATLQPANTTEQQLTAAPTTATPSPTTPSGTVSGTEGTITVTDDFGETVTIQEPPERIVSLAPANTEILFALGLGDRVVGVTDYCNYPPAALDKPKVGGYSTVNIEKVIAAEPDLVVASFGNTEDVIDHLRALGLPVIALNPLTIDDVLHDITLVGEATGQEEEAAALVRNLTTRIETVTDKTEGLTERPTVAQVVWYDPIWVSGNNTFQNEVIEMAGGVNAFGSVEGWEIVSFEEFVTTDPDYIIVNSGTGMGESNADVIYEYFMTEPRMQELSAVRENRIYIVDADVISRGGPRIVDALEETAQILHPDLFGATGTTPTPTQQSPGAGIAVLLLAFALAAGWAKRRR
jgi:iron complex transport system substrate-binding protein